VVEEKFLGHYDDVDPMFMIGMEGLWAFLIWTILLPIFQNISCSDKDLCPFGRPENTLQAFESMWKEPLHAVWILIILLICPIQ
jgi:hypothetical protein